MKRFFKATALLIAAAPALAAAQTPFSSTYTDLSKDCKWAFKESELREGQDNALRCQGYGGYKLYIYFSAINSLLSVEGSKTTADLQPAIAIPDYEKGMIEWRLAKGKPFAIIVRATADDASETERTKKTFLAVRGLPGFESIHSDVMPTKGSSANQEARELADKAYSQRQK